MQKIAPFIIVLVVAIGCSESNSENTQPGSSATPIDRRLPVVTVTPAQIEIAVDIPSLIGKSEAQAQKLLGAPTAIDKLNATDTTGEISYDYNFKQGSGFLNFKKGTFNYLHFTSKQEFATFFPLGDLVGLNLRGVVPSTSNAANIIYTEAEINGFKFKEVSVSSDGRYTIIAVRVK